MADIMSNTRSGLPMSEDSPMNQKKGKTTILPIKKEEEP
jgi:hypothetical protein